MEMQNMELELGEMSPAWWMAQCRKTLREAKRRREIARINYLKRKQAQMYAYLEHLKAERDRLEDEKHLKAASVA